MAKIQKIEDVEVLKTMKAGNLRKVVEHKFTEEEKAEVVELSKANNVEEYKAKVIELYLKYIDEVIAEEDGASTDPAKSVEEEEAAQNSEEAKAKAAAEKHNAEIANLGKKTEVKENSNVNLNVSYFLTIRGIPEYNGSFTVMAEQLCNMILTYPSATFKFRTPERAAEFIKTLKAVSKVKGIAFVKESARKRAIESVAKTNGLKA